MYTACVMSVTFGSVTEHKVAEHQKCLEATSITTSKDYGVVFALLFDKQQPSLSHKNTTMDV
jgi:hypothetical protein